MADFAQAAWVSTVRPAVWHYRGQPESEWPASLGLVRRPDAPHVLYVPAIDKYLGPGEVLVADGFGLRIVPFEVASRALVSDALISEMG